VSLELRPVPFPVIGWIWIGVALAVVAMGFGLFFSSLSNGNLGLTLVIVGLMLLPLNPWIHRRTPRRLDIDTHFIRFLRGNSVLKLLPWNRVEKIYYGRMKRRRMRRTFPVGTGNERVYISFIASTDLQSRLGKVLRTLESGVDQGLRPRLPDPLDPHEVLEDVRLGRLRGLELEDPPLDALVPRAPLERLRVRSQGVVVAAHFHEHIALRRPRLHLQDVVEQVQGLRVVPARARDERAAQQARHVNADLLDLLPQVVVLRVDGRRFFVRGEGLRPSSEVRERVPLHLEGGRFVGPQPEQLAHRLEALAPAAFVGVESDEGPERGRILRILREDPLVRLDRLALPIEPDQAGSSAVQGDRVPGG